MGVFQNGQERTSGSVFYNGSSVNGVWYNGINRLAAGAQTFTQSSAGVVFTVSQSGLVTFTIETGSFVTSTIDFPNGSNQGASYGSTKSFTNSVTINVPNDATKWTNAGSTIPATFTATQQATAQTTWNEAAWLATGGSRATGLNNAGTTLTGFSLGSASAVTLTSSESANTGAAKQESVTYSVSRPDVSYTPSSFSITDNVTQAAANQVTVTLSISGSAFANITESGGTFTDTGYPGQSYALSLPTLTPHTDYNIGSAAFTGGSGSLTGTFGSSNSTVTRNRTGSATAKQYTYTISFAESISNAAWSPTTNFVATGPVGSSLSGGRDAVTSSGYQWDTFSRTVTGSTITLGAIGVTSSTSRRVSWSGSMPSGGGSATITATGTTSEVGSITITAPTIPSLTVGTSVNISAPTLSHTCSGAIAPSFTITAVGGTISNQTGPGGITFTPSATSGSITWSVSAVSSCGTLTDSTGAISWTAAAAPSDTIDIGNIIGVSTIQAGLGNEESYSVGINSQSGSSPLQYQWSVTGDAFIPGTSTGTTVLVAGNSGVGFSGSATINVTVTKGGASDTASRNVTVIDEGGGFPP